MECSLGVGHMTSIFLPSSWNIKAKRVNLIKFLTIFSLPNQRVESCGTVYYLIDCTTLTTTRMSSMHMKIYKDKKNISYTMDRNNSFR